MAWAARSCLCRLLLVLLALRAALPGPAGFQEISQLSSYEVIIPQKLGRERRETSNVSSTQDKVSYAIEIEGKEHTIHLEKNKDLLPKDFTVYTYNKEGKLQSEYPDVQDHCHYQGYVEGILDSVVAVSTCSGLRGLVTIGNVTYGIEPMDSSSGSKHILYSLDNVKKEPSMCGVTTEGREEGEHAGEHHHPSMTQLLRKKRAILHQTRYVELFIVVDKEKFEDFGKSETEVREHMVQLANFLDSMYIMLNIHVVLVGLEIWKYENIISTDGGAGDVLANFVQWREKNLVSRRRHDSAQFVLKKGFGGTAGMAYVGTVCSKSHAGGINVFGKISIQMFASIMAHELGHNLGMNHDDERVCHCGASSCIMSSGASGSRNFSSCSAEDFEKLTLNKGGNCLLNVPRPDETYSIPYCGNKLVDMGEECDCGSPKECESDPCCEPGTCRLRSRAECAYGDCCKNCRILPGGTVCRASNNECDLPDYCNGTSQFCPPDFTVQNGHPCHNEDGYCYNGVCQYYDAQCQDIFGPKAKAAPNICFVSVNSKGDRFGNCGFHGHDYKKCSSWNAMCGKLQCENVETMPVFGIKPAIIQTPSSHTTCWGVDFQLGSDVPDPGMVKEGTKCGNGKVCRHFQCVSASVLNYDCDVEKQCHGHGHMEPNTFPVPSYPVNQHPQQAYHQSYYPSPQYQPQKLPARLVWVAASHVTHLWLVIAFIFVSMKDTLSYVLTVEGKPYTIHLKKHLFIPDDFRVYTSDERGSLVPASTHIKGDCYYHGSIEGIPGSAVTLSACAGLRGLLQFHNTSYSIEPLGSSPTFEHFVYRMSSENTAGFLLEQSRPRAAGWGLREPPLDAARWPKYLEVYVVLDKALFSYLGSEQDAVAQKVIQVFGFVNNIFNPLNLTVVLSSLELWMQQNKIPTAGAADELLQRFLQWKRSHLALRPHDVACLFVYRDQEHFAVATSPGTLCRTDASGAVAVLQRAVTLESFSVLLAQLLGRSLGMGFDDGRGCRCPTRVCVMESAALRISGAKAFSSCSAADLEQFLRRGAGRCLLQPPPLRGLTPHHAPICGNGVVEHGEQCDCGSAELKAANTPCRPPADAQCDLPEFCNGSSSSCPPDVHVQDGHSCEHSTGSAPVACYEELNSQRDRFGHCGYHPRHGYRACSWRNLRCGKLICTYPRSAPLDTDRAAVAYVRVREHVCVSLDFVGAAATRDLLLVPPGTKCGPGKDTLSYILTVEGRPYTVHLKQQFFIPADFSIYTYNETGSLRSDSPRIKGDCYYSGSIEGVPGSAVTLSTCAGLRGLLQFHNASYGIEPLGPSPTSQHVVYPVGSGAAVGTLLPHGDPGGRRAVLEADSGSDTAQPALKLLSKHRREVSLHVILERSLYRHLGDEQYVVSQRVAQLISFVSSMFSSLNVTVTLSSMELWRSRNKIQTAGTGEAVLLRFLGWKRSSAALRPHEVPFLLMYRDQVDFVGATSPGMLCHTDASGAVAVLQRAVTLESFSVLLAQLLGRSLGMGFDDGRGCRCPTRVCVMESAALRISGAKAFSSCSAADLEQFLQQNPECPFLRALRVHPDPKAAFCGNGVVEHGEQCDCGGAVACARDACCTTQCKLKPGSKCSLGLCCEKCQIRFPIAECKKKRSFFARSKNAPLACYEEINSHQDRFGHCGRGPEDGYQPCSWLNLGCGKLVCTYPNRVPFTKLKGAVIYAQVQDHLCVSFDSMYAPIEADPLLVKDGTKCGPGKVCLNGTCQPHSILNYDCDAQKKCHGHGVCNNKKNCHCQPGWDPPHCRTRGSAVGGSTDSGQRLREAGGHAPKGPLKASVKNVLLLSFCLLIPLLVCITILAVKWSRLMRRCTGAEMDAANGVLHLPNASYGIRPLEAAGYRHLVYQMQRENAGTQLLGGSSSHAWAAEVSPQPWDGAEEEAVPRSPRYLEMHVVLDKALYDYMGADEHGVTAKIVQLFSYVNSMFSRLNLTVVLTSLELWTERNKIPTTGGAEELLQRFLQWKNTRHTSWLRDVAFLLVYREQPHSVGASSAGKLCLKDRAGGVALYPRATTLEVFSVAVAQLLGLSLGMSYDDPGSCGCAGTACIMQSSAVHTAGTMAFSNCSIRDFEHFLTSGEGQCLLSRPSVNASYRAPVCGNKVVELGEECRRDPCCTVGCKARKGVQCLSGPCCSRCRFVKKGTPCRASSEDECELKEYCNGTSGACTPNLWVMDGHPCRQNTAFCYRGVCQSADQQCQEIFGKDAKNGPLACYEEVNGQRDRMGHCGSDRSGYHGCAWGDLRCGKLICEYRGTVPFTRERAAVIYVRVQNVLCVTLDYMRPRTERDPMLVRDGSVCGDHKVCMEQKCVSAAVLNYSCDIRRNCHDHGVCDSRGDCHCTAGWKPPDCREKVESQRGSSESGDPWNKSSLKTWQLLTLCLSVPLLAGLIFVVIKRKELRQCLSAEQPHEDE
ncbi:UNVERIFIED_CONTAM: hypothetical protein H355_015430 [Colinus virginianus]|nr:hypothetical protein H355_015430 [Colinus virginianus]